MSQRRALSNQGKVTRSATLERSAATSDVPERPALAPNVQLVGDLQGGGFTDRQWLIQRDGRFIQVTELLYRVAERANGEHSLEQIAGGVTESTDWSVTADDVRQLIQRKLMPLGLIAREDGTVIGRAESRQPTPLAVNLHMKVISPRIIDPIAKGLRFLYAPPILIPVLVLIALAHGWLYVVHGIGRSIQQIIYAPGLLLVAIGLMIVASVFHELGHAAALRYGGGRTRGMGVGLYLIYPAFYTDVTESYRLGRWARVRTDLGGFYFFLLFTLALMALYLVTGQDYLLFVVLLINLDIIYQCLPFVRFDGYWALADLTGIPDFFSQIGPFLRSVLPIPATKGTSCPT